MSHIVTILLGCFPQAAVLFSFRHIQSSNLNLDAEHRSDKAILLFILERLRDFDENRTERGTPRRCIAFIF